MRKLLINLIIILLVLVLINACKKENLIPEYQNPIDLELSTSWFEDTLSNQLNEKWYRYNIGSEVNQVYVEWSEKDYHGASRDYSADIKVDAYWLDGETEYFKGEDMGYGTEAKLIGLNTASGLLVRVSSNNESSGTFALKVYEKDNSAETELLEINIADDWYESSINVGETIGFLVKGGTTGQEVSIQWGEFNSPEKGYSADIKGSVYKLDGLTAYKIAENSKSFSGKDKSHSDNPKSIVLDQGETEFIVIIGLNDSSKPGNFAIQTK